MYYIDDYDTEFDTDFIRQPYFDPDWLVKPDDIKREVTKGLNPEQKISIYSEDDALLVVSPPGGGKTLVLTKRVEHLINDLDVYPKKILMITFTNKAALEMKERLKTLVGDKKASLVYCTTFHSFAHRLMRINSDKYNLAKNFPLLTDEDSKELIKKCAELVDLSFNSPKEANYIINIISLVRNKRISIKDALVDRFCPIKGEDLIKLIHKIKTISMRYETYKQEYGLVDFDDLLIRTRDLLVTNSSFRKRVSSAYNYILVDEVQDCNAHQTDILKSLVRGSLERGRKIHIFACGDEAQSIYAFRGADYKNMSRFPEIFNGQVNMLKTNYRSSQEILDFANKISDNFMSRWKQKMVGTYTGKKPVYIRIDKYQQYDYIANIIEKMIKDEGLKGGEIAILCRSNLEANYLEPPLVIKGIEVERRGGTSLLDRLVVKDALAVIRATLYHTDVVAWDRMLRTIKYVGAAYSEKIYSKAFVHKYPYKVLIEETHGVTDKRVMTKNLGLLMKEVKDNVKNPVEAVTKIFEFLKPYHLTHYSAMEYKKLCNVEINAFLSLVSRFSSLRKLITDLSLNKDTNDKDEQISEKVKKQGGRVVISTQHASKGLEYDTVIIPNLAEPFIPSRFLMFGVSEDLDFCERPDYSFDDDEKVDEERRLFYVACTRARHNLFLVSPMREYEQEMLKTDGELPEEYSFESRFMLEIPNLGNLVNTQIIK